MAKAKKKTEFEIPSPILNDICSRFVVNADDNVQFNKLRVFYITEVAHWHYVDFLCSEKPELPRVNHKMFTKHIFAFLPELSHFLEDFDNLYQAWLSQKRETPTYGAILLSSNLQYVLMVQGFSKNSWSFPKGKIDMADLDSPVRAAIREVDEETGLDISNMIRPNEYLENTFQESNTRLYIITGVSMDHQFEPQLRQEIKDFRWFPVHLLPTYKNDPAPKSMDMPMESTNFFRVIPFVKPLRRWIAQQKTRTHVVPASQFTAQGRSRRGKDGARRQGQQPGPQGDAPSAREGQGRGGGQTCVVWNNEATTSGQQGNHVANPGRGATVNNIGGRRDQYQDLDTRQGKGRSRATDKPVTVGRLRLDEFHSKALLNFRLDMNAIMERFKW